MRFQLGGGQCLRHSRILAQPQHLACQDDVLHRRCGKILDQKSLAIGVRQCGLHTHQHSGLGIHQSQDQPQLHACQGGDQGIPRWCVLHMKCQLGGEQCLGHSRILAQHQLPACQGSDQGIPRWCGQHMRFQLGGEQCLGHSRVLAQRQHLACQDDALRMWCGKILDQKNLAIGGHQCGLHIHLHSGLGIHQSQD